MDKLIDILKAKEYESFFLRFGMKNDVFNGSLSGILDDSKQALEQKNALSILINLPRLLIGAADYCSKSPAGLEFKRRIIQANYHAFIGNSNIALGLLEPIPKGARKIKVWDVTDDETWKSTNPIYVQQLFERIGDYRPDHLFMTGHGAYRPGFLLASLLEIDRIYAMRYSKYKMKDETPQLSDKEREQIRKDIKNKSVLVIEDDMCSGETIDGFVNFLEALGPAEIKKSAVIVYDRPELDYYGHHEPIAY